jgi:P-type conjugative transfer protein TrbJ
MIFRSIRLAALASAAALSFTLSMPAQAQVTVFDPSNYAQNVMTAARELQQVQHQITALQNQAQMLINQGRNLTSLPYSAVAQFQADITRTQQLLSQAQGVIYNVGQIQTTFARTYPNGYTGSTSSAQLILDAQSRWSNTLNGYQDALKTQATVVGNLPTSQTQVGALVNASQGATGALQAAQAGNQLLALVAKQLADVTALLAAQGRAQSLQGAQAASNQDQSNQQMQRFIAPSTTYQPQAIAMFH